MRSRVPFDYHARVSSLGHEPSVYAFSVIITGQFIFLNLHYVIGATLLLVAITSLLVQFAFAVAERAHLDQRRLRELERTLVTHYWVNQIFTLAYLPFFVWVAVIMYQRRA